MLYADSELEYQVAGFGYGFNVAVIFDSPEAGTSLRQGGSRNDVRCRLSQQPGRILTGS